MLGALLYGGRIVKFSAAEGAASYDVHSLFAAIVMVLAAGILLTAPSSDRPSRTWCLAALIFPAWLGLQLIPLPQALVGFLSPSRAELLTRWLDS